MHYLSIKKIVFILSSSFIVAQAYAAEASSSSKRIKLEPTCRLLATPHDDIIDEIVTDINAVQPNGYIGIESPSLSNQKIIDALISAAERNVTVKVFVNDPSKEESPNRKSAYKRLRDKNNISITEYKPIPEITNRKLHTKRVVIKKNIRGTNDQSEDKVVYIGSLNMTQASPENHEIMMRCTDTESFKESFGDQQRLGRDFYDRVVKTPFDLTKRTIMHTTYPQARAAKKELIEGYGACAQPDDYLYITAYKLDDPEFVQSIIQAKQSGKPVTVLLDGESWQKNPNKIKDLFNAGVDVYVFNKHQDITTRFNHPKKMHIKAILRKCNGQCQALITTANLTLTAKEDINQDLWEPCTAEFAERLKDILDNIIRESKKIAPRHFPA